MNYTKSIRWFHRYFRSYVGSDHFSTEVAEAMGGPESMWAMCSQLLGCPKVMPAWLRVDLAENEGLAEQSVTYHEAAVDLLTEHWLNEPPETWVPQLYPVFVKVCEVNGAVATKDGFVAWLDTMVDEEGITEAMAQWSPA